MLDSSTLTFKHFTDPRVKSNPEFIEGLSGPLMLATDKSGRKYIVKHACFHNAANELVASWLGYKIGAPTPHAYLLRPSEKFPSMYGVAIQFIEGLKPMDPAHLSDQMQQDITAQFALNLLIDTDDKIQMSEAGGRIYSIGICSSSIVHRHVNKPKGQGILIETKPGSPRSLAINCAINMEGKMIQAKHLCLQTSDGGILILDCKVVNGRLEFNGPIKVTGLQNTQTKVIGCRELDDDAYYDAIVM